MFPNYMDAQADFNETLLLYLIIVISILCDILMFIDQFVKCLTIKCSV